MAAYFNSNQLRNSIQELVRNYISECKECDKLSQDCIDLIRHNFLAEFVVYNKEDKTIEVGMSKTDEFDRYPEIEIYTFPLDETVKKVDHSFKNNHEDLEFYGRLLGRQQVIGSNSVVVME
ncbi:hypothetical protein [Christiangramia salexigens]|uniref:Uncharacterized protein n=1 Tax=Christiangramia salexigens TaxID=1913577 RepID=A0A1L3J531_9FLAO|nr:hypothetical protein [Christiangramia salexigens]APG60235.1 hypothetical protein LPB144_07350 [Christiangramia salexigens]